MKKIILVTAPILFCFAQATEYIVIVSQEHQNYDIKKFNVETEITDWENYGSAYNCSNPSPLASEVYNGVVFDQTFDCDQEQKKYEKVYHVNIKTGEKTLYSTKELESQIISIQETKIDHETGIKIASSCLDILTSQGPNIDGIYSITPKSNEINVYCDMTNGGYTQYKMSSATELKSTEVEAKCAENNLQLFVPRSEAHLTKAVQTHTGSYFKLMGLYPNYVGAKCNTVYLTSNTCSNWSPKDGGKWFVYNWDLNYPHNGGGFGVYPEPNGDNSLNASMIYTWDNSTGKVLTFNDITDSNTSYPGGYKTTKWTCSAKDENNI